MANEKYALLDTDFISKMHLIRKDDRNKLIDKIMAMPNYTFYCHDQINAELLRHNTVGPSEWFRDKVKNKLIYLYDDEMILDELTAIYGNLALTMYVDMLKTACDAYKAGYFEENFKEISKINALHVGRTEFLEKLTLDCEAVVWGKIKLHSEYRIHQKKGVCVKYRVSRCLMRYLPEKLMKCELEI